MVLKSCNAESYSAGMPEPTVYKDDMQTYMMHAAKQNVGTPKLLPGLRPFPPLTYCVAICCDTVDFTMTWDQY